MVMESATLPKFILANERTQEIGHSLLKYSFRISVGLLLYFCFRYTISETQYLTP